MKTTLRKLTVTWPLVIFLLLPALTRAETAVQAWVQLYNGDSRPSAVAVDGSNNVIVTGTLATIKYSGAGVPLWTNANDINAVAVAVDGNNNVIVTYGNCVTVKYSSAGIPLWTNSYSGPYPRNGAYAMAIDGSNDVIVTAVSTLVFPYGLRSLQVPATIKYSSAGVPLWTNLYNQQANDNDSAWAVAVDSSNNVVVTGYWAGDFGDRGSATIKYSSAGAPLWTNICNGPGNGYDFPYAVAVDGSNNVIVTGYSASTNVSPYNYDYATIKYSSDGVPLWTNRYNGPGNDWDEARAVAVDGSNNVIVTGGATDSGGCLDYATIKYSSAGVPLWTNRYNGPGDSYNCATAVTVDHSGNVIVTGCSAGSGGDNVYATIKYVFPLVITDFKLTNDTFQMLLDNLQPGTLVIQASTNLSTTNWAPVFTNTTPTNVLFYTDPDASNAPTRFYRAFQFP